MTDSCAEKFAPPNYCQPLQAVEKVDLVLVVLDDGRPGHWCPDTVERRHKEERHRGFPLFARGFWLHADAPVGDQKRDLAGAGVEVAPDAAFNVLVQDTSLCPRRSLGQH